MSSRFRRVSVPVATFVAGLVVVPAVAYAATATFAATTKQAAITASSNTVRPVIDGTRTAGTGDAMVLRNRSTADGAMGVHGKSYATSGNHSGIWGTNSSPVSSDPGGIAGGGVFGDSLAEWGAGVIGRAMSGTGVIGSGFIGVESDGELLTHYHFVDQSAIDPGTSGDVAGQVTVPAASETASVTFQDPFFMTPSIVLTPTGQPNGFYWVTLDGDANSDTGVTGFTVHTTAGAGDVTFNYVTVGFVPASSGPAFTPNALAGSTARTAKAASLR